MSDIRLPDAEVRNPSCGACGSETDFDGDVFACYDCDLGFSHQDFHAFFLNPDAAKCGKPCENTWHARDQISSGVEYDCGTCQLPDGHKSECWTGCRLRRVEE